MPRRSNPKHLAVNDTDRRLFVYRTDEMFNEFVDQSFFIEEFVFINRDRIDRGIARARKEKKK